MMNRFKWGAALMLVLLVMIGAGWLIGAAEEVPEETAGAAQEEALSPRQPVTSEEPVTVAQTDETGPALQARSGWPFAELPLVIKATLPEPVVAVRYSPPRSLYERALIQPLRRQPIVASRDVSPLWLLAPLAAGVGVGSVSAYDDGPGPTPVPEPSLLLLVSTGLLIIGIRAIRRA